MMDEDVMKQDVMNTACDHCSDPAKYVVKMTTEDYSIALCGTCIFWFVIENRSPTEVADLTFDEKRAKFALRVIERLAYRVASEVKE